MIGSATRLRTTQSAGIVAFALMAVACRDRLPQPLSVLSAPDWAAAADDGSADRAPATQLSRNEQELPDDVAAQLERVLSGLDDIGDDELRQLAISPDRRVRRAVSVRLSRQNAEQRLGVLETLAEDEVAEIRFHAFTALGRSGNAGAAVLIRRAASASEEDLLSIIAGAQYNADPALASMLSAFLSHSSESIALAAARALPGRPFALPPVAAALADARRAVACEVSVALALAEHPTEALPEAPEVSAGPQSLGCFAALEVRHGNTALIGCAEQTAFEIASPTQQIWCVYALLASDSAAAPSILADWQTRSRAGEALSDLTRLSHLARSQAD